MFVSKAKAFPSRVDFGCFPIDKASDFWKGLLAYLASSSMTKEKSFIKMTHGNYVIRLFTNVNYEWAV